MPAHSSNGKSRKLMKSTTITCWALIAGLAVGAALNARPADAGKLQDKTPRFSHPREITNQYLPLAWLKQDILEGTEAGRKVRIERTAMPQKHKSFKIGGQKVEALAVEDREFEDGKLAEVAMDYFAQDDDGVVYYLGEDVDEYKNGKVSGHSGAWLLGRDTQIPGVILPTRPKVGDKFKPEDVSREISETDEVVSVSETVVVPAGAYKNCLKVKESLADGTTEFKYYAPGVGCVKEVPPKSDVSLKSHTANPPENSKAQ